MDLTCPIDGCGYTAQRKTNLAIHLNSHSGIKPFQCNICQQRFVSESNLTRHKKTSCQGAQNSMERRNEDSPVQAGPPPFYKSVSAVIVLLCSSLIFNILISTYYLNELRREVKEILQETKLKQDNICQKVLLRDQEEKNAKVATVKKYQLPMLLVLTIALFVGLATSRPSDNAIVDINPDKYCGCTKSTYLSAAAVWTLKKSFKRTTQGVRFTLTVNSEVWMNETLSGKNPPPLCQGLQHVADICVQVYNMSYDLEKFGGCLKVYGDLVERVIDIELGCYYIPLSDELVEIAVDEQARLHSLFQISNNAKDLIVDEMHKWSHKDGDLGEVYRHNEGRFPEEPLLEETEES